MVSLGVGAGVVRPAGADSASSGAASTSMSSGSAGAVTFSCRAAHGSVVPCIAVLITTVMNTMSNTLVAPGTRAFIGMVASTIGAAPRSPAQERNPCCRQGTRTGNVQTSTAAGAAGPARTRRLWPR